MRTLMRTTVVVGIFALSSLVHAQGDPNVGTWKLNLTKSKFDPGPPPKSLTRTYEPVRNGIKVSVEGVDAFNNPIRYGFTATYDGKEYPLTGLGVPGDADRIAVRRADIAFTVEETLKQAAKHVFTIRRDVSQKGKVLTLTGKGMNAAGQPINNVTVYDKQ